MCVCVSHMIYPCFPDDNYDPKTARSLGLLDLGANLGSPLGRNLQTILGVRGKFDTWGCTGGKQKGMYATHDELTILGAWGAYQ